MNLLGIDVGSSSVKASVIASETGHCLASAFYPKEEMPMKAAKPGWAEQEPRLWWDSLKLAVKDVLTSGNVDKHSIAAIGISYQMHGLVLVDKNKHVIRPSIIWCDSRAVEIGEQAFREIGVEKCLSGMLNSPGNFTASKLKWVRDNEPDIYDKTYKMMLPGDYIAMLLTGEITTTISGLSEGILWDFSNNSLSDTIMRHYGMDRELIPDIAETFAVHGELSEKAANELGLVKGTKVSYRAGDQPNNAFSLNVLNPGEIAATAGTSGVVYGVSDEIKYDPESRVNTFAHVNHSTDRNRLGVLLCINGTGIQNSWLKKNVAKGIYYDEMNKQAGHINIGSNGLVVLPFGNGAERMLKNKDIGSSVKNINFNIHTDAHLYRAAQEGIVFAFNYGMDIMGTTGIKTDLIRAGHANMFLSPVFRETLAGLTGSVIELYDTDGSRGASLGAGIGAGIFNSFKEAFGGLKKIKSIEPGLKKREQYTDAYETWKKSLENILLNK